MTVSGMLSVVLCAFQSVAELSAAEEVRPVFEAKFDDATTAKAADGARIEPVKTEAVRFAEGLSGRSLDAATSIVIYPGRVVPAERGTLEIWLAPLAAGTGNGWYFFSGDSAAWGPDGVPRLWMYEGNPRFDVDGGGRLISAALPPGVLWVPGSWHQFVGTWDCKGRVELYVDGRLLVEKAVPAWKAAHREGFSIGSGKHIDNRGVLPGNALIDRVRIYDRVLPAGAVRNHFLEMGIPTIAPTLPHTLLDRSNSDIRLTVDNVGGATWKGDLSWTGGKRSGTVATEVETGQSREVVVRGAFDPGLTGDLKLSLAWSEGIRQSFRRSQELALYVAPPLGPPPAQTPSWRLVRRIRCAEETPVSEVGKSTVVGSPLGRYRQAGSQCYDRFAYLFNLSGRDRLLRLTIEHPDDAKRCTMLSHSIPDFQSGGVAGTEQQVLGHGILSGGFVPLTGKPVVRQYVFPCPSDRVAVITETGTTGQNAAAITLALEEAEPAYGPPCPAPLLGAKDHRHAGLYWEDPVIGQDFGWTGCEYAPWDASLRRAMDYLASTGQRLLVYPSVWYHGPIYRSRVEEGTWPSGGRHHPPDYVRLTAIRCAQRGIQFVPTFTIWRLPSLASLIRTADEVAAGVPSVNTVDRNGKVLVDANWGSPPLLNALHPRVQKAIFDLIDEHVTVCGDQPSFAGIGFALWPSSPMHVAARLVTSYDDWSVTEFARHIGQRPPGEDREAKRFRIRAEWILNDVTRKAAWVRWRCDGMTRFYAECGRHLAKAGPNAKLRLMIQEPYPEAKADPARELLEQGLDIAALNQNPHIIIDRWLNQTAHRSEEKDGRDPASVIYDQAELTRGFQMPFQALARPSVTFHQQYFESHAVLGRGDTPKLKLPEPWKIEAMGRACQPTPWGRHFLRHYARSMLLFDPEWIAIGGFTVGTMGAEDEVRQFVRAFHALPAVRFGGVGCNGPVIVRTALAEGARWAYAVNVTNHPADVQLKVGVTTVLDAETGKAEPIKADTLVARLAPYELRVWRMDKDATLTFTQPPREPEAEPFAFGP